MLTIEDKMWPQPNCQPSLHHGSDESIQFTVFPSIYPIQVSAVDELVDEPNRMTRKDRGKGAIAGQGPGNIPGKATYDQASTMRFVGFSSDTSNRSCLKSDLLFSFKYVERPWTPMAKRER